MKVGIISLGEIKELDGESIKSRFFILGVPLFPIDSYYSVGGDDGIKISLNGTSVLAGYLRMYVGLGALLTGIYGIAEGGVAPWVGFGVLFCLWIGTLMIGRTGAMETLQRSVLKAVTGMGAYPSMLPMDVAAKLFRGLKETWVENHEEWGAPEDWKQAIRDGSTEPASMGFLYAMAMYDQAVRPGGEAASLARQAWAGLGAALSGGPAPTFNAHPMKAGNAGIAMAAPKNKASKQAKPVRAARKKTAKRKKRVFEESDIQIVDDSPSQQDSIGRRARFARNGPKIADSGENEGLRVRKKRKKKAPATTKRKAPAKKKKPTIRFECPECGHAGKVPVAYAGKKGKCRSCGERIRIPDHQGSGRLIGAGR